MTKVKFVVFKKMILISRKYFSSCREFEGSKELLNYGMNRYFDGYVCLSYDELVVHPGNEMLYVKAFDKENNIDHIYNLKDCVAYSIEHTLY